MGNDNLCLCGRCIRNKQQAEIERLRREVRKANADRVAQHKIDRHEMARLQREIDRLSVEYSKMKQAKEEAK